MLFFDFFFANIAFTLCLFLVMYYTQRRILKHRHC